MNCVTFAQASAYCARGLEGSLADGSRVGVRRAMERTSRRYPWGDEGPGRAPSLLGWARNSELGFGRRRGTCTAGAHPAGASPFGVLDLAGNVWQWTSDLYSRDYASKRDDPRRVVRGGTWYAYEAADVRSAVRMRVRE